MERVETELPRVTTYTYRRAGAQSTYVQAQLVAVDNKSTGPSARSGSSINYKRARTSRRPQPMDVYFYRICTIVGKRVREISRTCGITVLSPEQKLYRNGLTRQMTRGDSPVESQNDSRDLGQWGKPKQGEKLDAFKPIPFCASQWDCNHVV